MEDGDEQTFLIIVIYGKYITLNVTHDTYVYTRMFMYIK